MKKKQKFKTIEMDMSPMEFYLIAKEAHDRNITFNQRVNQILEEQLKKLEDPKELAKFEKTLSASGRAAS